MKKWRARLRLAKMLRDLAMTPADLDALFERAEGVDINGLCVVRVGTTETGEKLWRIEKVGKREQEKR